MTFSAMLSCCVVALDVVAYFIYNWDLISGKTKPYRASWAVWVFLAVLNSASYLLTSRDVVKSLLSIENAISCGATFVFALIVGRGRPLQKDEKWVIGIGVTAGIAWWIFRDAFYANAIMQVATAVSFISLVRGVLKDPKSQRPLPWLLWSLVYTTNVVVVALRWDGNWQTIVYPINYVGLHVGVLVLTFRKR